MEQTPRIELVGISKTFGSIKANQDVCLKLYNGEILSLLGENGSGKTSLMNVLSGIYYPDEGDIFVNGEKVIISSPHDAYKYHIGMVHQHFKLVETFTAVENVVIGLNKDDYLKMAEEGDKKKGFNLKASAKRMEKMCAQFGFKLNPWKRVNDMSVSEKQTLEIVKALFRGVDVLILDEPTAVLTPQEAETLFDVLRNMKAAGKSIIIITHKLNEVLEISDRVSVLCKGKVTGDILTKDANEEILTEMMVGHKVDLNIIREDIPTTGVRLEVHNLTIKSRTGKEALKNVSFDLYGSEILGVAGISGSGQKELLETIAGLNKETGGDIIFHNPKENQPVTFFHKNIKQIRELAKQGKFHLKGSQDPVDLSKYTNKQITEMVNNEEIIFYENEIIDLKNKKPIEIRDLGIKLSFIPEDRLGMGLVGSMDLIDNMMLRSFRKGKGGVLHREAPRELAAQLVEELEIKTPSLTTSVKKLSGGNIQKVLVGREISTRPKVLMTAYPVRGLDINSSYLIYKLLSKQKAKGTAIIYVGEDLDILLALCDRVLVLRDGEVAGILNCRETNKKEIGLLMTKDETRQEGAIND